MNREIKDAITALVKRISEESTHDSNDALKYTQAVLNLAHARATLGQTKRQ